MKCCESRIKKSQPTAITFKRTFQCIFSTITSKRSTYNFEYLSVFHSCIDPDKKKIIPDPRNSSGSNRIRIYNTVLMSNVTNLREKVEKDNWAISDSEIEKKELVWKRENKKAIEIVNNRQVSEARKKER